MDYDPTTNTPQEDLERERNRLSYERTRLSLERTFLSWIRTGLTGVALGIAFARFIVFKNMTNKVIGHNIGLFLVLWGLGIFIFALISYRKSYRKLYPDQPQYMSSFLGHNIAMLSLIAITIFLFFILSE
ncbi:MAG: DUF202 domain-containing protein [Parachlamydiaceae bacterium]|nr:DUF202 domain-containing protein [Parachlamydiaceae bacterium]